MAVFTQQIEMVNRLLTKYGRTVSIYTYADTTPDSAKPWRTGASTSSTQTGVAAFFDYTDSDREGVRHSGGELILIGDKQVYLSAKGITKPTPKGELRIGSEIWKIVRVATLSPNGENVLYTLQVRQ